MVKTWENICRRIPLHSRGPDPDTYFFKKLKSTKEHEQKHGCGLRRRFVRNPECLLSPAGGRERKNKNNSSQSFPDDVKSEKFRQRHFSPSPLMASSVLRKVYLEKKKSSLLLGGRECQFRAQDAILCPEFCSFFFMFSFFFSSGSSWMDEWHRLFCWLVFGRRGRGQGLKKSLPPCACHIFLYLSHLNVSDHPAHLYIVTASPSNNKLQLLNENYVHYGRKNVNLSGLMWKINANNLQHQVTTYKGISKALAIHKTTIRVIIN